jgi:hypothetical protein
VKKEIKPPHWGGKLKKQLYVPRYLKSVPAFVLLIINIHWCIFNYEIQKLIVGRKFVKPHTASYLLLHGALMAAWRSGRRICLRNRRPGFESRQGIRSFGI